MLVELGLVGGDGLDLDDLLGALLPRDTGDDAVRLVGVAGPVDDPAGPRDGFLELQQVLIEVA